MNVIEIAFSERAKRNPVRIATDSVLALATLLSVCFAPVSASYAQKSETESPNSYSTPIRGQSSLRPIDIDENLRKDRRKAVHQSESSKDDTIRAEIDAIKQIRQQMNSAGLSNLFDNPQEADRQFEEELARLAINRDQESIPGQTYIPPRQPKYVVENPLRPIEGPGFAQNGHQSDEIDKARMNEPGTHPQGWNSNEPSKQGRLPIRLANPFSLQPIPSHPGLRVKISAVRAVATQLEESAAELENLQLYDDADTVRSAASGLWRRARSIETDEPKSSEKNASRAEPSWSLNR